MLIITRCIPITNFIDINWWHWAKAAENAFKQVKKNKDIFRLTKPNISDRLILESQN